jgi:hypothetical protein
MFTADDSVKLTIVCFNWESTSSAMVIDINQEKTEINDVEIGLKGMEYADLQHPRLFDNHGNCIALRVAIFPCSTASSDTC